MCFLSMCTLFHFCCTLFWVISVANANNFPLNVNVNNSWFNSYTILSSYVMAVARFISQLFAILCSFSNVVFSSQPRQIVF